MLKQNLNHTSHFKHPTSNKGITLIALIITIIVMLILVAVTISMAINGGLFEKAGKAVGDTQNAINAEQQLANGAIQIGGKWYNSIDEYINQGDKRKINVEYTKSEGQDLWNSTVTFNISLEEENNLTLEQKKEIVAYMYDCSNYAEFKSFLENSIGKTYEEILEQFQMDEKTAIDTLIEMGKNWMSFKDIAKLESLGIKVISVKTPYDTTLYTTSLGGEVACTFIKNGTYTFDIQSGGTKVEKSIEINNIRDYSTESPHDVRIDFYRDSSGVPLFYSLDGAEEYSTLNSTDLNCANTISLKFDEDNFSGSGAPYVFYVSRDEQFYKYFANEKKLLGWYASDVVIAYYMKVNNLTSRQVALIMELGGSNFNPSALDNEWLDYMDDYAALKYGVGSTDYKSDDELLAAYPKASIGNEWWYNAENSLTLNITKDTSMYIVSTVD